jgi:hypothetical protein
VYPGTAVSAGDSHLFKRATTGAASFAITVRRERLHHALRRMVQRGRLRRHRHLPAPSSRRPPRCPPSPTKKGHLRLENLDIRAPAITVANDAVLMYLSNSATVVNCNINTNIGGIGIYGCSNVTIQSCTVTAVTHSSANNNQCLDRRRATDQTSIAIDSNTFLHGGGGGTTSHNDQLRMHRAHQGHHQTRHHQQHLSTVASASCSNTYAMGCASSAAPPPPSPATLAKFHQLRPVRGGWRCRHRSLHFVEHLRQQLPLRHRPDHHMVNCIIQYNTCSSTAPRSTTAPALFAYGRGIELSSAAGQSSCASHIVRFNVCKSNLNYGGVNDNGSEGVGIGLDDGCVNCLVYGNDIQDNEGNGIQLYGGGNSATWTDTHNTIFANFFKNNCVNSVYNRRTGGTFRSVFCADINLAYTYGGPTVIANNLHAGSTSCGVAMGNSNRSVTCANNVMLNMANNFMDGRSTRAATDYRTNILFGTTNFQYVLDTVDGNSSPTYPIISGFQAQTDTITSNPLMSSGAATAWMPAPGSPAIAKGTIVTLATNDFQNNNYKSPPTIGMLEFVGPVTAEGGHRRKQCLARR